MNRQEYEAFADRMVDLAERARPLGGLLARQGGITAVKLDRGAHADALAAAQELLESVKPKARGRWEDMTIRERGRLLRTEPARAQALMRDCNKRTGTY